MLKIQKEAYILGKQNENTTSINYPINQIKHF